MKMARGYRATNEIKMKELNGVGIGLNYDALLIIKLPDSRVLRIVSRSLFLAMVILALPSIGSFLRGSSSASYDTDFGSDLIRFDFLPILFQDLADEGLLKRGHKGLIVSSGIGMFEKSSGIGDLFDDLQFLNDNDIDMVIVSDIDLNRQSSIPYEKFDVVFTSSSPGTKFVDQFLKIGGIVVMQLSNNPSNEFQQQPNYKTVYLRRFDSTVVAMRKTGMVDGSGSGSGENSPTKRRLCESTPDAKKTALKGLEDVLLEPPRRALEKLSNGLRKINFLPDLLGDSLQSYHRRIFITDEKSGVVAWFYKNYPTRNQYFETYNLEIETYDTEKKKEAEAEAEVGKGSSSRSRVLPRATGVSGWLMKNVREEDYVVMKAEAQVVEEMIKEKTICLVDELFLECKNQWQENKSNRAYWQCLALYGRLRDEGVAVHQWWG